MTRDKTKGEVRFTDSEGNEYVLRLGTNDYITVEKQLLDLTGREFQRALFHQALVNGAEAQKDLTLEDAGDIIDDLGLFRATELFDQTRFGKNVKDTSDAEQRRREAAEKTAKEKAA